MEEKYFILDGIDSEKSKDESKLREVLQKHISTYWKQQIEIVSILRDVHPEDIGFGTADKRYMLLRVRGEHIEQRKGVENEKLGFTLKEIPSQIILDCELKVDKKYIEIIPELAEVITELIGGTSVAILQDDQNEYWLKGKWFQVAISKRILMSAYVSSCKLMHYEAGEVISNDGYARKILSLLLAEDKFINKSPLKSNYGMSMTVNLALCCLTIGLRYSTILKGRNISIQLVMLPDKVGEVKIIITAAVQSIAKDGMTDFSTEFNNINKNYSSVSLPEHLPVEYKMLLNDIVASKFKPELTIIMANGQKIIYAVKISNKDALENFVTRHIECAVPSPTCGMNVLRKIAKPYHSKSLKEKTVLEVPSNETKQHEGTTQGKSEPTHPNGYEGIGVFVAPSSHMNYLNSSSKITLEGLAKDHDVTLEFSNDNEEIKIKGTDIENVQNVLKKIQKIYHSLALVTKELPYGMVENTPEEQNLLILHCSDSYSTSVTGPKSLVEKLESKFHPDSPTSYSTAGTSRQNSSVDHSLENVNASSISDKGSDNLPKQPERRTRQRRTRQLLEPGSEVSDNSDNVDKLQTPISPSMDRSLSFNPVLGNLAKAYRHCKSGVYVEVGLADITKLNVDAIVNAANGWLKHEGGVAYAIAKAAGPEFDSECLSLVARRGQLQTGQNCKTRAGNLPCNYVIHAVGPIWRNYKNKGECLEVLKDTFMRSLEEAGFSKFTTLAIPALFSGIYGVPQDSVASMGSSAVSEFLHSNPNSTLQKICFTDQNAKIINFFNIEFKDLCRKGYFIEISNTGSEV